MKKIDCQKSATTMHLFLGRLRRLVILIVTITMINIKLSSLGTINFVHIKATDFNERQELRARIKSGLSVQVSSLKNQTSFYVSFTNC